MITNDYIKLSLQTIPSTCTEFENEKTCTGTRKAVVIKKVKVATGPPFGTGSQEFYDSNSMRVFSYDMA